MIQSLVRCPALGGLEQAHLHIGYIPFTVELKNDYVLGFTIFERFTVNTLQDWVCKTEKIVPVHRVSFRKGVWRETS